MYRIGTVNIDTSHAPSFAQILLNGTVARYSAVYNDAFRTDAEVEAFIERFGLEKRYYDLAEMAKNVDIAFLQGCDWDKHVTLAKPFIDAGVPVFVDKPFVGCVKDVNIMKRYASSGAKIIGSSSLRYTYEHDSFFAIPKEERGEILHVTATVGVDEFNYAIHASESIMGFMRDTVPVSTRFVGSGLVNGAPCDTFFVMFANGSTACYHICLKGWQPSTATVITEKSTYVYKFDLTKIYEAMLKQVCLYLEGKENSLVSVDSLCDGILLMLAGKKSKENGGGEVVISELTDEDKGFDGAQFEAFYASQQ